MNKKATIKVCIKASMIAVLSVLLLTNCEKETDIPKDDGDTNTTIPVLTTTEVTEITQTIAISGGVISSDGGALVTERGVCWSTSENPTIADNKTLDGVGAGTFISSITDLTANTTYYLRAYATNSKGTGYGSIISFTTLEDSNGAIAFNPNITYGSVNDIEGNTYKTVVIGAQTWMAENLKTTKYNDGTAIPNVTDDNEWENLSSTAYCWYKNNINNGTTYGALYNWYAVHTGKLCPTGWHVPTDDEWTELENYLANNGYRYDVISIGGGENIAKALASDSGWESSTSEGTVGNTDYPEYRNKSGFTALPCGNRDYDGGFYGIGSFGSWWSATEYDPNYAWLRDIGDNGSLVFRFDCSKNYGFSVRCVRD